VAGVPENCYAGVKYYADCVRVAHEPQNCPSGAIYMMSIESELNMDHRIVLQEKNIR
jgi:hypothetical protein